MRNYPNREEDASEALNDADGRGYRAIPRHGSTGTNRIMFAGDKATAIPLVMPPAIDSAFRLRSFTKEHS